MFYGPRKLADGMAEEFIYGNLFRVTKILRNENLNHDIRYVEVPFHVSIEGPQGCIRLGKRKKVDRSTSL